MGGMLAVANLTMQRHNTIILLENASFISCYSFLPAGLSDFVKLSLQNHTYGTGVFFLRLVAVTGRTQPLR